MNELIITSTNNANLDLFIQLVRGLNKNDLINYLDTKRLYPQLPITIKCNCGWQCPFSC